MKAIIVSGSVSISANGSAEEIAALAKAVQERQKLAEQERNYLTARKEAMCAVQSSSYEPPLER